MNILYLVPCFGIVALIFTMVKAAWVTKQDAGTDRMKEIAKYISEGAMAFLRAEYKILAIYVVIAGLLLAVMGLSNPGSRWVIGIAFVIAAPIAWYFMHQWLQQYTFRISIGVWFFIITIVGAISIAWLTVGYTAIKAAMTNPVESLRME